MCQFGGATPLIGTSLISYVTVTFPPPVKSVTGCHLCLPSSAICHHWGYREPSKNEKTFQPLPIPWRELRFHTFLKVFQTFQASIPMSLAHFPPPLKSVTGCHLRLHMSPLGISRTHRKYLQNGVHPALISSNRTKPIKNEKNCHLLPIPSRELQFHAF